MLLNCTFSGNGWIQPHQRWATGLLIDGCKVPDGGIDFMNRGEMGSGHGWSVGWAVAWNCVAKSYLNQQPRELLTGSSVLPENGNRRLCLLIKSRFYRKEFTILIINQWSRLVFICSS
ncbi:hypothetical protein LWM68_27710 [Niabella sp. W65]|nr:hypothetical protein [Niabella sp. W65]MCH7366223.1 hypothetical protein [Niabella sp. W65]ULT41953.1 hypothetical protein KRR40_46660 [Niabella sp. I65]